MISRTYDQRRETAGFVWRKLAFAFAVFSAFSRPKRKGRKIEVGLRRTLRDLSARKWRRKPLKWLEMDAEMAGRRAVSARPWR
jgi:hypothetical protein